MVGACRSKTAAVSLLLLPLEMTPLVLEAGDRPTLAAAADGVLLLLSPRDDGTTPRVVLLRVPGELRGGGKRDGTAVGGLFGEESADDDDDDDDDGEEEEGRLDRRGLRRGSDNSADDSDDDDEEASDGDKDGAGDACCGAFTGTAAGFRGDCWSDDCCCCCCVDEWIGRDSGRMAFDEPPATSSSSSSSSAATTVVFLIRNCRGFFFFMEALEKWYGSSSS
jgi:hypothetical protein